jgi:hypothetical protein
MTSAQTTREPTLAEQDSKDAFFHELAEISERMVAAHGKDFSMGALVLAARFIAEGKTFNNSVVTQ